MNHIHAAHIGLAHLLRGAILSRTDAQSLTIAVKVFMIVMAAPAAVSIAIV